MINKLFLLLLTSKSKDSIEKQGGEGMQKREMGQGREIITWRAGGGANCSFVLGLRNQRNRIKEICLVYNEKQNCKEINVSRMEGRN